jgi:hypothetical protein
MSDSIVLPRAAVEALVDPERAPYMDRDDYCNLCHYDEWTEKEHNGDCPVRVIQEALRQPQIACDEHGEPLAAIYRDYESTPELEAMIVSLSTSERMLVEIRSRASRMATIDQLVRGVIVERTNG